MVMQGNVNRGNEMVPDTCSFFSELLERYKWLGWRRRAYRISAHGASRGDGVGWGVSFPFSRVL